MKRLLTLKKARVWHVGSPRAARRKVVSSLEGTSFSVSEHPRAWTKIARLGGSSTFMLTRKDGKPGVFVNRYALSKDAENALLAGSGLVTPTKVYVLREETSDENGEDTVLESVFPTLAKAEEAADPDALEDGYATIVERDGWKATPELNRRWAQVFTGDLDMFAGEFALMEAVEALGLYDGMWWKEDLDPWSLSAPRGGIFQSRLPAWGAVGAENLTYVEAVETWDEESP